MVINSPCAKLIVRVTEYWSDMPTVDRAMIAAVTRPEPTPIKNRLTARPHR
jgi:hypothetical protein